MFFYNKNLQIYLVSFDFIKTCTFLISICISAAIERKVKVELLLSDWDHTIPSMLYYLRSLQALNGVAPGVHIRFISSFIEVVV